MNGSRWLYLFLFLFSTQTASAVEAVVAYTVFHKPAGNGSDSAFIEIYWQINPNSLHYQKNEKGQLIAQVQTALSIQSDSSVVLRDRYVLKTTPLPPGEAAMQRLTELHRYYVPNGHFKLRLDLGETGFPNNNFQHLDTFSTQLPPSPFLTIQLLDTFFTSNTPSPFYKNGYQQLPSNINFLDEGHRQLHFYTELYQANSGQPASVLDFYISKKPQEQPFPRFQLKDTIKQNTPLISRLHSFDMSTLATGNYYLTAVLRDFQGNDLTTKSVFFQMVNKHPAEVKVVADTSKKKAGEDKYNYLDLSKTFVAKFSVPQLRAILKMIVPFADPAEANTIKNFFKNPDELYIRYFIFNYFGKNNKAHPEDAWKEFSALIKEVNREFNSGGTMGYETDRGNVYLKYGKPDERIHVANESGAVPYEVWRYNTVGKTSQVGLFLFYQPGFSASDYRLLHSTVPGEANNTNWRSVLYSSGQSGNNSRAEQYFGKQ